MHFDSCISFEKKNKQYNQYEYNKRHHFPFTLVKLFTIL